MKGTNKDNNTAENAQNTTPKKRPSLLEVFGRCRDFVNNWKNQARKNQRVPKGNWLYWLLMAGRGFGKTRTGAETIREWALSGKYRNIALIGDSEHDVRSVMIEGRSGILAVHSEDERPTYYASQKLLVWPNGVVARIYTSEAYEKLRGPEFDCAWVDELAKFKNARDVLDQLNFCLRAGDDPKVIITTTPRPIPVMADLASGKLGKTVVTTGSTYDNSENLPKAFIQHIESTYGETRMGRQEIEGELLLDNQYGLWNREMIEESKTETLPEKEDVDRIVIAVDPAISNGEESDETGIVVCAKDKEGQAYVLEDLSGKYSVHQWSKIVVDAYKKYEADRVIAEVNQGGDMVEHVLRAIDSNISYAAVHASRGKIIRAEPVAALYEQGKVKHYRWGGLRKLEDQMLCFSHLGRNSVSNDNSILGADIGYGTESTDSGGIDQDNRCGIDDNLKDSQCGNRDSNSSLVRNIQSNNEIRKNAFGKGSPDRVDALVWGITELMLSNDREENNPFSFGNIFSM